MREARQKETPEQVAARLQAESQEVRSAVRQVTLRTVGVRWAHWWYRAPVDECTTCGHMHWHRLCDAISNHPPAATIACCPCGAWR